MWRIDGAMEDAAKRREENQRRERELRAAVA
jgi:hypothetical protein